MSKTTKLKAKMMIWIQYSFYFLFSTFYFIMILLTWWTWFIGSHTAVELLQAGHEVVILDNLVNSNANVVDAIHQITGKKPVLIEGDLLDMAVMERVFADHDIDAVIHFAGLKAVGISCQDPFAYYDNNILGTTNLLRVMDKHEVRKLIFSSSATVYDAAASQAPFAEDAPTGNTTNPYGTTKFVIEQLLKDMSNWKEMDVIALRYFNPVGAHSSGLIWEDPSDVPTNLLPVIMEVVEGKREQLSIFGDDYNTPDGTCIRDYIHVVDLASAHLAAVDALTEQAAYRVYNVGTGNGTSVAEMVAIVNTAADTSIPTQVVPRRSGDIAVAVAQVHKIQKDLWREAKLGVKEAVEDAMRFRETK